MLEQAELIDLIAHKIRFITDKIRVLGINKLLPLQAEPSAEVLKFIELLGGTPVKPDDIAKNTDVLFIQLKGMSISQMLSLMPDLLAIPGWSESIAVAQKRVYLIDDLVFEAGSATERIEILAEIIHPKLFAFGYEGQAWVKVN